MKMQTDYNTVALFEGKICGKTLYLKSNNNHNKIEKMKHVYFKMIVALIGLQICSIIEADDFVIDGIKYRLDGNYVTVIGGDTNASELVIPETVVYNDKTYIVEDIAGSAFRYNQILKSITIPNSITRIGERAFERCTSLSSLTFLKRDKEIYVKDYAFYGCAGLPSVIMDGYVSLGEGAFYGCTGLLSVTCSVPYGYKAFAGCVNLQNITLKGSSVWKKVFEDCDNIKTITVSGKSPGNIPSGDDYPFPRKVCLTATLYVPEGSLYSYMNDSDGWGEFVDIRETESSGIQNTFADKMKIYVSGGQLALDNISVGEHIFVYKSDGSMVKDIVADSQAMRITLPSNNVYIIKVANETCKVFIP